ncbi:MAG TPA: transglycosylase SLT domain-containing protein [Labilithrix sp.]|nr:transglycosylase SLT domain-containing protein [Labilithrix sp.]
MTRWLDVSTTLSTFVRRRAVVLALTSLPISAVGASMSACSTSSDDDGGDPDVDPIAWVSPTQDANISVNELLQLTVKVNDPAAKRVQFSVDGVALDACDTTNGPHECRREELFQVATKFDKAGPHHLEAVLPSASGDRVASLDIQVRASAQTYRTPLPGDEVPGEPASIGAGADSAPPPTVDRGFLDPDRPLHNVFGGVSWAVAGQRVEVVDQPSGNVSAIAACMKTYGASIIKHADANGISRASVVATAITESNCTNPSGSSDGLSSGPMQVTGYTCRAVVSGFPSDDACKKKMHEDPDFSFLVGAKVIGESYAKKQHGSDPPKIAATYNAGSVKQSNANRWHMVVTGNHIDRFVGAYNAYRAWEAESAPAKAQLQAEAERRPEPTFAGENVRTLEELPAAAREGQVYFVGRWPARDGAFVTFRDGAWHAN